MKFLVVDDHAIVRKGIIELLRAEFSSAEIVEAFNGAEALIKVKDSIWDLILLDISMPVKNGIETLKQLRLESVRAPILMLSMQPEEQYAIWVLKEGASGFINKENTTEELIIAVRKVISGKKYISAAMIKKLELADNLLNPSGVDSLSDREMQVLKMIASGKTVTDIATEISLKITTISTYRAHLLEKLHLTTNAELIRFALDNGLPEQGLKEQSPL